MSNAYYQGRNTIDQKFIKCATIMKTIMNTKVEHMKRNFDIFGVDCPLLNNYCSASLF